MSWLFYALLILCMTACGVCGICRPDTCAIVGAVIILGGILEYRQCSKPKLSVGIGLAVFFLLTILDGFAGGGYQKVTLSWFLDVIWALIAYRALRHEKTAEQTQVAVLTIIPLVCVVFALQATGFLAFLVLYLSIWFAYLSHLSLQEPTTGCVAAVQRRNRRMPGRRFWLRTLALSMLAFMIGCLLFLLVPRYGGNDSVPGMDKPKGGFPDVALDKTGKIELDPSLLFRVQLPEKPGGYYWRIDVQNVFDGSRWRSFTGRHNTSPEGVWDDNESYPVEFVREWRDYRIPATSNTVHVEVNEENRDYDIRFYADSMGLWRRWGGKKSEPLMGYRIWLDESPVSSKQRSRLATMVMNTLYAQLGLPVLDSNDEYEFHPGMIWPGKRRHHKARQRLYALARDIVGDAQTDKEKADRISQYLKTHYQYSLDRPERKGPIVEDFLFEQKFGHCEVFSTTMAVLLALVDVPVHNVSGFVSSEFRDGYNNVRSAHAHSWVEVYLDGEWTVYDPTPSGAQQVEVDWILMIDDWFSSYQSRNLYRWIGQNWLAVLIVLLSLMGVTVSCVMPVRMIRRRLQPSVTVWENGWQSLTRLCAADTKTQPLSVRALEDWWGTHDESLPEMKSFAQDYISFRYGRNGNCEGSLLERLRENHRIIARTKMVEGRIRRYQKQDID